MSSDKKKPMAPRGDDRRAVRPNDRRFERDETNRGPKPDLKKKLGKRH